MSRLADAIVTVLGGTACLAGSIVLARRAAGALDGGLPGIALLAVAGFGVALVAATDALARLPSNRRVGLAGRCAARAGLAAAFAALAGLADAGPATVLATAATLTAIAWPAAFPQFAAGLPSPRRLPSPGGLPSPRWPIAPPAAPAARETSEAAPPSDGRFVQRFERIERTLEDGRVVDEARGMAAVRFTAGARTAVAHVGFCPPFERTPGLVVSCSDEGLEMAVAAAEVLPWGARIECRLEEPAEETIDVEVAFATTPG